MNAPDLRFLCREQLIAELRGAISSGDFDKAREILRIGGMLDARFAKEDAREARSLAK